MTTCCESFNRGWLSAVSIDRESAIAFRRTAVGLTGVAPRLVPSRGHSALIPDASGSVAACALRLPNTESEVSIRSETCKAGVAMSVENLVRDWGGFEKLVAELHETGEVTVRHDVTLVGGSGTPRQIDVLIRHRQGLYEHLIAVECKYWSSAIERIHVDALATTIREVGASRGVIFSTKGFQSGAVTQAAHERIDLFKVRELTDEEWGLPGRVVDLFLQTIQSSIGNLVVQGGAKAGNSASNEPISLRFEFGLDGPLTSTPTLTKDGSPGDTVETQILDGVQKALDQGVSGGFTINGGVEGTHYMKGSVNLEFSPALIIPMSGEVVIIPKISLDLGVKIVQSRITVDRARKFKFALALENCINGKTTSASRRIDATQTVLNEIAPAQTGDATVVNGSILRAFIKGFFPFEEIQGRPELLAASLI